MDLYFFLKAPGFSSHITFSNFAPRLTGAASVPRHLSQAVPMDDAWNIRSLRIIDHGDSFVLRSEDFSESEQKSSLFFLSQEKIQGSFEQLVVPEEYETWPNWRANLSIRSQKTAVSYQGDYPSSMLKIPRGSLVSAGKFFQNSPGIHNGLFLVNFTKATLRKQATVALSLIRSKKILAEFTIESNQVNYINLDGIEFPSHEITLVTSKDIFAVPVYFCHSSDKCQMSLEHSHSPLEFTVFGENPARFDSVKKMKGFWLEYASKPL